MSSNRTWYTSRQLDDGGRSWLLSAHAGHTLHSGQTWGARHRDATYDVDQVCRPKEEIALDGRAPSPVCPLSNPASGRLKATGLSYRRYRRTALSCVPSPKCNYAQVSLRSEKFAAGRPRKITKEKKLPNRGVISIDRRGRAELVSQHQGRGRRGGKVR